jgi:hypothetical protein
MKYPLKQVAHFVDGDGGRRLGLRITCPNCGTEFTLWFRNPIGGGSPTPATERYYRTGESMRTLSLSPSFDAIGHFHSTISDGEFEIDTPFACESWRDVHR